MRSSASCGPSATRWGWARSSISYTPTGQADRALGSDPGLGLGATFILDTNPVDWFLASLNVGTRLFFANDAGYEPLRVTDAAGQTFQYDHLLTFGVGLSFTLVRERLERDRRVLRQHDLRELLRPARTRRWKSWPASRSSSSATATSTSAAGTGIFSRAYSAADGAGVRRVDLRAVDRRPRRRRHQGRRRPVPRRPRGLRRLRGRGRLPRSRTTTATASSTSTTSARTIPEDRDGDEDEDGCPEGDAGRPRRRRHPRRRATSAPTTRRTRDGFEDDGRLPGPGQRQGRHPRRRRPVPERARGHGRLRGRRTAAPTRTTTRTASSTSTTSAPTSRRPTTASRTRTAARTRAACVVTRRRHRDHGQGLLRDRQAR
ncbi:MAG: hypothetical protein MZV63_06050 [Marinilabiliales bacterium]|nr:hypothetical protein [Marinilabiliales bacterium]